MNIFSFQLSSISLSQKFLAARLVYYNINLKLYETSHVGKFSAK